MKKHYVHYETEYGPKRAVDEKSKMLIAGTLMHIRLNFRVN